MHLRFIGLTSVRRKKGSRTRLDVISEGSVHDGVEEQEIERQRQRKGNIGEPVNILNTSFRMSFAFSFFFVRFQNDFVKDSTEREKNPGRNTRTYAKFKNVPRLEETAEEKKLIFTTFHSLPFLLHLPKNYQFLENAFYFSFTIGHNFIL